MKKRIALILAALMLLTANTAFAAGLKDFSVSFDDACCFLETEWISLYASGVEVDDSEYLVIDTLAQNNKPVHTYEVSIPRASVNGIEIYPTYREDVEDECDEPIEIDLSNVIEWAQPSEITDIELAVHIEDDEMETLYDGTVHIYPLGEDKAATFTRASADTDVVLLDTDKITVTVTGTEYVEDWGYSVHLYIENHMQEPIYLEGAYYKLNDVEADTMYYDIVGAGGVCISHLEWSQGDLDDAEVTDVTSVKFLLRVYDYAMDNMLYDEEVELNP